MSVGAILTLGFGSFGSVNLLPTLGYGTAGAAYVAPQTVIVGGGFTLDEYISDKMRKHNLHLEVKKQEKKLKEVEKKIERLEKKDDPPPVIVRQIERLEEKREQILIDLSSLMALVNESNALIAGYGDEEEEAIIMMLLH